MPQIHGVSQVSSRFDSCFGPETRHFLQETRASESFSAEISESYGDMEPVAMEPMARVGLDLNQDGPGARSRWPL